MNTKKKHKSSTVRATRAPVDMAAVKEKADRGYTPAPAAPRQEVVIPNKLLSERRAQGDHLIGALVKAASDIATIDVDKMERLWAMHKEAEDRRAELEFAIAKNALAKVIPAIPKAHMISFIDKNKVLQETPYANREDIEKVIGPLYREAGFSTEYTTEYVDGKIMTVLIVRHNSGHKEIYRAAPMPLDTSGSKNNNQAAGSTSEYGMRYCLKGAFNVMGVDKDDDGNMGATPTEKGADKFAARVNEQAAKPAAEVIEPTAEEKELASLANAALMLHDRILSHAPGARRGEILMANVKLIGELEQAGLGDTVKSLRALAEVPAHA